jgi:hypothetical protein
MSKARKAIQTISKPVLSMELERFIEAGEVYVEQKWEREETHFIFDDGSVIVVNNQDVYEGE